MSVTRRPPRRDEAPLSPLLPHFLVQQSEALPSQRESRPEASGDNGGRSLPGTIHPRVRTPLLSVQRNVRLARATRRRSQPRELASATPGSHT